MCYLFVHVYDMLVFIGFASKKNQTSKSRCAFVVQAHWRPFCGT